ncbi:UBX domain-containing protein 10-like [Coregonus clupeaformis]|uniref:UBX domain-containing protein 10-like n=1 Tax=Coregonus clupeaformis TaxID=59861 RepID=UPI001E1C2E1F|nr:UBX domain-containing protein 10-like [Coregonus clupeaformis]
MHLTRPKSSKGRSRPNLSYTPNMDVADSYQDTPLIPKPPSMGNDRSDRCLRSRCQSLFRQSSQLSVEEVPDYLDTVSEVPYLPFPWNKYKPLPSIEKKLSEEGVSFRGMEEKTSKLSLSDSLIVHTRRGHGEHQLSSVRTRAVSQSNLEIGNVSEVLCKVCPTPYPPDLSVMATPQRQKALQYSLAIRAPCGRRFEHHFLPTDTLLKVLASAEARYWARYEHGYIVIVDGYVKSGVDRPLRRTFTDLNMTLAQCGILNRSVLWVFQEDMDSA